MKKLQLLEALQAEVADCHQCEHLAESRTQTVFGVGNPSAELMFIGEAPGAEEDRHGVPFVGRSGSLLTQLINKMGLRRDEVFIANILKCRPDTPGGIGNRKPNRAEISECLPYLFEQIKIIEPYVVVLLGATPLDALFALTATTITKMRGQVLHWTDPKFAHRIQVIPTWHPAYVLRNPTKEVRQQIWLDCVTALKILWPERTTLEDCRWLPTV